MASFEKIVLLIKLLSENRGINIDDIQTTLNVKERQARRYLAILKEYLNISANEDGKYSLYGNFIIDKNILSMSERSYISALLDKTSETLENKKLAEIIKNKLSIPVMNYTHSLFGQECVGYKTIKKNHELLDIYIKECEEITFIYEKNCKEYCINPYQIIFNDGFWYLLGSDGGQFKTFAIDYIQNLKNTGHIFIRSDVQYKHYLQNAKTMWYKDSEKSFTANITISALFAPYFKRKAILPFQKIIRNNDDGSIDLEFLASSENEFRYLLTGAFGEFKVNAPEDLKKLVSALIEKQKSLMS